MTCIIVNMHCNSIEKITSDSRICLFPSVNHEILKDFVEKLSDANEILKDFVEKTEIRL